MDWSKAKTVLICMFLVLNIFLAFNIYKKETQALIISPKDISDIQAILKQNSINLNASMPLKILPKSFLKIEDVSYTEEDLVNKFFGSSQGIEKSSLQNNGILFQRGNISLEVHSNKKLVYKDENPLGNIEGMDKTKILKYVSNYLNLKGFNLKNYSVEKFASSDLSHEVIFRQTFKEYQLFGSYIKVGLTNKGINSLEILWFNPKQFVDSAKEIKSPVEILLIFSKDLQNTAAVNVNEITLGYYTPTEEIKNASIYAIPVWKIKTDSEVFYYNAYEGYLENKSNI